MSRLLLGVATLMNGLGTALVPVLAVFALPVRDYGIFSLVYLVFAEGWSIQLSAVCDTWARRRTGDISAGTWADYTNALATVSGLSALLALLIGFPMYDSPELAVAMALGVGTSLYRQGARYHQAVACGVRKVLPSDSVAVLALVGCFIALRTAGRPTLDALLFSWALSGIASASFYLRGRRGGCGPVAWYQRNRSTIRPLVGESLLMDSGATGTPALIAPILGLQNFGIYRSVSSLSVPIQLLIDPLRPNLSQLPLGRMARWRGVVVLICISAGVGLAGFAGLSYFVPTLLTFSPVLLSLSRFAVPCSLFLTLQMLTYVLTIFARMHVSHRQLIVGRGCHTVLAIVLPLAGALTWGTAGAIWCFVATTSMTVILWTTLLAGRLRHRDLPVRRRGRMAKTAALLPGIPN